MKRFTYCCLKTIARLSVLATLSTCGDPAPGDPTHTAATDSAALSPYATRPIYDDIVYFVLPDRFADGDQTNNTAGLGGDALTHGYDPTHKGFYHGGDLKGLFGKLDYLEDLGVSAIWLAPVFKNKPVQYHPGGVSAGYHGYWILDFLDIDPHFGTKADFKRLVDAAHDRNMKVIMDIVINHSADVIKMTECHSPDLNPEDRLDPCSYRTKAEYPYTTRGGTEGSAINAGFKGDGATYQTSENFAKLTNPNYAYTPFVPDNEKTAKNPEWLNNPIYYHNRGESHWEGESSLYGDFAGLDDFFTENPRVVEGFIDIYKYWISEFKIDGFRIDTVRHVNDSFWRAFIPAILTHAREEDVPQFTIFGEAWSVDPSELARFTHEAAMPSVLDFAFQDRARKVISQGESAKLLSDLYDADKAYAKSTENALKNPIFLGNHDMGRIGHFLLQDHQNGSPRDIDARAKLSYALMFYGRGVPTLYYGDEQGFTGDGHDQDAREDMFVSQVISYNDNPSIGGGAVPALDNFNTQTPLFQSLKHMISIYRRHPALRRGDMSVLFASENAPVLAISRQLHGEPNYIFALNASEKEQDIILPAIPDKNTRVIDGRGEAEWRDGNFTIKLDRLSYALITFE